MADPDLQTPRCASCNNVTSSLKRCGRCQQEWYCNASCQKSRWPAHKAFCNSHRTDTQPSSASSSSATRAKNLSKFIDKPFHKLHERRWLHDRPEADVYKLLIDCFRFRQEDEYLNGDADEYSIYGGHANSKRPFIRFLKKAEDAEGVLPSWWSPEKRNACIVLGMKRSTDSVPPLACCVEKSDIQEEYGQFDMPMQLRMLADQIYGHNPYGHDGSRMMQMQMAVESGNMGGYQLNMGLSR